MRDGFFLMVCLLLSCSLVGCQSPHSQSAEAPNAEDPFAALHGLSRQVSAMAELARVDSASQVPGGQGEGALHVLRLLRRAIDEEIAWANTDYPYFQAQDERYAKLALGNPDNLYLVARLDDDAAYRVAGRLGTTSDFSLQIYQGYPGVHRPFIAKGAIGLDQLIVADEEGRFEIFVGGEKRGPNWLPLEPGSRRLLVRFTYSDWAMEEAGEIHVERLGSRGLAAPVVSDAEVADRIRNTSAYLEDAMTGYMKVVDQVYEGLELNSLRPMRRLSGAAGGLSNQYNVTGRYAVDDEHVIVVTARPSDAAYQGFQIGTEWFEALDFVNQTTSLNTAQAKLSSDGIYRFVISARDPGVANWLDASAAPQGQILMRWQRVGELGPRHEPTIERVPFDLLRSVFPADEPEFGEAKRRLQIAERQDAIARRYSLSRD